MRKTLYFDKDANDILEQMPQKKQSEFAREAVKFYHRNKDLEQKQTKPKPTPQAEVTLIG